MAGSSNGEVDLKRACCENGQDWISSLPDEVLIHILSLVPTDLSVRTSILSSRWKSLWASVPTLDFVDDRLTATGLDFKVSNFIDKVLFRHNLPSIKRFCLKVAESDSITQLNAWIEVIVRRGVQKVLIINNHYMRQPLSHDLFTCKTLVELELSCLKLDVPDSVYFPCLKIFRVTLHYATNDLTTRLFCSCPVLEQLYICGILSSAKLVVNIFSPVLKTLELQFLPTHSEVDRVVMIDAPVLEKLSVNVDCRTRYVLKTQSPVLSAKLSGNNRRIYPMFAFKVLDLLKEIPFVKHLHLSTATVAALNFFPFDHLPLFPHVTKLELDVFYNTDCRIWSAMLHCMPNLSTFMLWRTPVPHRFNSSKAMFWIEPLCVPTCVQSCIVEVIVKGIEGLQSELDLIKFFLNNAKNLSRVALLHVIKDAVNTDKFFENLAKILRSSETCQVEWDIFLP